MFTLSGLKVNLFFFTLFYVNKGNYCFVKIFDYQFLVNVYVLGCPKHIMTISEECLSVTMNVTKICDKCSTSTEFKFYFIFTHWHKFVSIKVKYTLKKQA